VLKTLSAFSQDMYMQAVSALSGMCSRKWLFISKWCTWDITQSLAAHFEQNNVKLHLFSY